MDATSAEPKTANPSNSEWSLAWITLREFLLFTLSFSGIHALLDLYRSGHSIANYLLEGAFISAFMALMIYRREKSRRNLKSKTYFHPDN